MISRMRLTMSKISVIVPVYNVDQYLKRCLDSILSQTYTDFEVILVNDGSKDSSGKICDEYCSAFCNVFAIHQENAGLSAARNTGIDWVMQNSDSEWLTFIDSDDWIHERTFETLIAALRENNADISVCKFERTFGAEPIVDTEKLHGTIVNTENFYIENNVVATVAWGKIYKKSLFSNIRYPVGKIHEDEYTTYKLLFRANKVVYIDQPLYYYYQNPKGIMKSAWNPKRMDVINAYEQQIFYFQDKPEIKKAQIKRYETCLYNYICTLNNIEEYSNYKKALQARLRKLLIKYRQVVKWEEVPHIAEKVFPRFMKYYWIFLAQRNKIRK